MADQNQSAVEVLLDVKVAEAPRLYKFYLNQEKKILGSVAVAVFLIIWELVGNTFQWINPMFLSAPSLVWSAAVQLFSSVDIFNDLYISGSELFWGSFLSAADAIPFAILIAWCKRACYVCVPVDVAMNANLTEP